MMKKTIAILCFAALAACSSKQEPAVVYMPDMYHTAAYKAYIEHEGVPEGRMAYTPVKGTLSREGWVAYNYENTQQGYDAAKANLKSPLEKNEKNLAKGKEWFGLYCAICHGDAGDGQGILMKNEVFLGVPNYKDRDITEGSIFHVITYGKGTMGSHASQLEPNERWQVVQYVQSLKEKMGPAPAATATATPVATPVTTAKTETKK
jgi:mono/diheme cytochrome c family protein